MSRPTRAEIDLDALRHNFAKIRRAAGDGCEILVVVKADAYGHGVQGVVPALNAEGADQFGVAMVDEGIALRRIGLQKPIVVMGGVFAGEESALVEHRLTPVIYDLVSAQRLDTLASRVGATIDYHLKVDTGMGRLGFAPEQLPDILPALKRCRNLTMIGLMSHLAMADEPEKPVTDEQIERFFKLIAQFETAGFRLRYRHIANSAAVHSRVLPECNLVRPGIALYGGLTGATAAGAVDQRQVMRLVSEVAQVKTVPQGSGVSYGHRFVAARTTRLAAVPIGYADGYNRLLSNRADVLIKDMRAPVAGTVCMDWILVDVTEIPDVQVGDRVVLLGRDREQTITAEEWAEMIGSITYEVFCGISNRVPRIFVDQAKGFMR
jgi:alanine racemase